MERQAIKKRKLNGHADGTDTQNDGEGDGERSKLDTLRHDRSTGPSAHEMLSAGAYKSPLLKLQIDELLGNMLLKHGARRQKIDDILHKLKAIIESIPARRNSPILDAEERLKKSHGIAIPFPDPRPKIGSKYTLAYAKPASVNVIGSYAFGTAIKTQEAVSIDMSISMPSSLFQEKDYLNYRYFYKRAYYIACIVAGLQDNRETRFDVKYEYLNGNSLQPILRLGLVRDESGKDSSDLRCVIRVIPVGPDDLFPTTKTLPARNCVRPLKAPAHDADDSLTPTPFYNATLRSDCVATSYLKLLHGASVYCQSLKNAAVLGRLWLRQRGFGGSLGNGGFGHFEWTTLMALLLQRRDSKGQRGLSSEYSSYQLFKATLQFLSARDVISKPLVTGPDQDKATAFQGPTIFDTDMGVNLLFKMTPWSYSNLRRHATTSLEMMNDALVDHFDELFIAKVDDPLESFDLMARLPLRRLPSANLDHESPPMRLCHKIHAALDRGLGDRVEAIDLVPGKSPTWSTKTLNAPSVGDKVELRLVLKAENAGRTIDHGPSAEKKKEAAAFRDFWGEKAELRRFKDGAILETLVWAGKSQNSSASSITQEIVSHLLRRHVHPDISSAITFAGDSVQEMLSGGPLNSQQALAPFQSIMTAFSEIEAAVRHLEELPLQLRQLSGSSSALRYTSMVPPPSKGEKAPSEVADVVLQFEGSGRWPDDLVAVQQTKIALLLKLAQLLDGSIPGHTSRLALENDGHSTLNGTHLDFIHPNGSVFRFRIQNEREETLNERKLKDKALGPRQRGEAVLALAEYKRIFVQAPSHTQSVRGLCTRFPLLSQTIRLVKTWFASHLLSLHFAEELMELLAVRTFVQPYPWQPPSSVQTGFLRTLRFLSRWDWRLEPLILNMNGELSREDVEAIVTRFEAWRRIDPAMNKVTLFVASNLDPDGVTWTQSGPSKVVAARMTALARAACAAAHKAGLDLEPAVLFKSPTSNYDFLIHLNPRFLSPTTKTTATETVPAASLPMSEEDLQLTGYQPIRLFIEELQSIYTSNILFFYNTHGGTMIAGLWNPRATSTRPWKVTVTYSTKVILTSTTSSTPADTTNVSEFASFGDDSGDDATNQETQHRAGKRDETIAQVIINKAAILNEIARLGGDMVSRIEVLKP